MRTYHNRGMTLPESVNAEPPKGWRLVKRWPDMMIKLEQKETKRAPFRVTYGLQVDDGLTYAEACSKLGEALLHALACDGLCSNEGD